MKATFLGLGLIVSLVVQLFFLQSWQIQGITANVVLAFLVIASLYAKPEQELWMCLLAGLFCDLYSSIDFGFYLGFYLLVGILVKYVLKFGDVEYSWWRPIVFIALATLVQGIVASIPLFGSLSLFVVTQSVLVYVILSTIVGVVWYLLFAQMAELVKRTGVPKFMR